MIRSAGHEAGRGATTVLPGIGLGSRHAPVAACAAVIAALVTPLVADWRQFLRQSHSVEVTKKKWGFSFTFTENTLNAAWDPLVWHHLLVAGLVFIATSIALRALVRRAGPIWVAIVSLATAACAYGLAILLSPDGVVLIPLIIPGALAASSALASALFDSGGPPDVGGDFGISI